MCSTAVVVQYSGGCTVQRRDIISTAEGYHQYRGGIPSVQRWMFSPVVVVQYSGGILSVQRRDNISTAEGYHQYRGGILSVPRRDTMSTTVVVQYSGGMISHGFTVFAQILSSFTVSRPPHHPLVIPHQDYKFF